jgi:predicted phosphate transport protein (TIGR00153 family)
MQKILFISTPSNMKFNNILSVFTPKDVKFFPLLQDLSAVMVQAGAKLHDLIANDGAEPRSEICKCIKQEEIAGDKISARIVKELNNTFITPFDREDINELADKIEEVIDIINRVALKIQLYSPNHFTPYAIKMTEIIQNGTREIQEAVESLDRLKKSDAVFRKHYKEIKKLEEEADSVYEKGIMDLFKNESDTIELIKLKEIIQELEKAANKINSAGKVLKTIFVKYA